ncbi:MAG: ABC transporter transmembrane domain-containing protein [Geminicoccaceae bacterium]|nr:ABC transporter transmembrane domain-containing protein [Geminicoccaceae bacterium]MDW8340808.1 ABC transporter transmembrane domain-containing protein [Geminicoccaceae bacterium]
MEPSIFRFILKYSWRQQLLILALTILSFPPLYYSLELPKLIINKALGDPDGPWILFGWDVERTRYLFALCGLFLLLVLIGGLLKYVLNVYAGIVAERMLRRLRYQLYEHVLRFPLSHFRKVSQGELVQMINAETEALGGFVGDAIAVPAFQGGTLLTILVFVFVQDPILGLAAIVLYPVQIYLIPKLQRQVNELAKQRVRQVRRNAERIGETCSTIREIHAHGTARYELARFSEQLGTIFWIRFAIYKKKFMIKFLNNFIAQLGPFLFFSIGGYLVIRGDITLGSLVAVVAAHKDLSAPWRELLTYYQTLYDVRVKYEQTVSQFLPPNLQPVERVVGEAERIPSFSGAVLKVTDLGLKDDSGEHALEGIDLEIALPAHVALVGPAGSGREELTLVLAGLVKPSGGKVTIDGVVLHDLPEPSLARKLAYVSNQPTLLTGTLADNLLYGLKQRPVAPPPGAEASRARRLRERREALASGNSADEADAEWVDWEAVGLRSPQERLSAMIRVLRAVALAEDVYAFGLRGVLPPGREELASLLLEARRAMRERLASDERLARLVEPFDPDRYNTNATVAENLLFGRPLGNVFDLEHLPSHPHVRSVLAELGLVDDLMRVGYRLAETMVELFSDLPHDHEYYRRFAFIAPEDLPEFKRILGRASIDRLQRLRPNERERLLELPFKLVVARHRLGLVDETLQARILRARRRFRQTLPPGLVGAVAFFDPERYNPAASVQENVLFGKIAYGQPQAHQKVAAVLAEVLEERGLVDVVIEIGLHAECGVGGSRLSLPQRQKLAIARELFRRPEILVLHEATAVLDAAERETVRTAILRAMRGRSVIWSLEDPSAAHLFDRVVVLERGRVVAQGTFGEVAKRASAATALEAAG